MRKSFWLIGLAIMALGAPNARAGSELNYSFSFTNTKGNVPGTVTGEILGLTNNATGPAAKVLIISFPAGLDSVFGPAPINATLWVDQFENSFTVVDGVVTSGAFWAEGSNPEELGSSLYINAGIGPYNYLNLDNNLNQVWGANGLAAANIQPLSVTTPEPSSLLLFGTSLLGLAPFRRKLFGR
jgi:hypothetical protein